MDTHVLTRMKLLNCQVCSTGTEEEALDWLRESHPAGTLNNWLQYDYTENPEMTPVRCLDHPERTHYMFAC